MAFFFALQTGITYDGRMSSTESELNSPKVRKVRNECLDDPRVRLNRNQRVPGSRDVQQNVRTLCEMISSFSTLGQRTTRYPRNSEAGAHLRAATSCNNNVSLSSRVLQKPNRDQDATVCVRRTQSFEEVTQMSALICDSVVHVARVRQTTLDGLQRNKTTCGDTCEMVF